MEDFNLEDLPQFGFISDAEVPLCILDVTDSSKPPHIVYNSYLNEENVVSALSAYDVVWNYAVMGGDVENPDTFGILYQRIQEPLQLIFVNAKIDEETGEFIFWLENNLTANINRILTPTELYRIAQDDLEEPAQLISMSLDEYMANDGLCTGILIDVPYHSGEDLVEVPNSGSNGRKVILLSNDSSTINQDVSIGQNVVNNEGNLYSYAIENGSYNFCLTKKVEIQSAADSFKTQCNEYSGRFAIEINGVVVPYSFAAEDLPKFFTGKNEYPIKFEDCDAVAPEVPCEPYCDFYVTDAYGSMDGSWRLTYSINDGELQVYSVMDRQPFSYRDIFREFIEEALRDFELDGGGGGLAVFQMGSGSRTIYPGDGSEGKLPVKLTIYRSPYLEEDVFDTLFNPGEDVDTLTAMSCGYQYFEGY